VHSPLSRGKIEHLVMFSSKLDFPASLLPTTTTRGSAKSTSGIRNLILSRDLLKAAKRAVDKPVNDAVVVVDDSV